MKLIVGLGNPGRDYVHTRHNVGFDVLDVFAQRHKCKILTRQCHALVGSFDNFGEQILLAKPQTYMNESGISVGELTRKYRVELSDIFIVYDDMDLPLGKLRIKPSGSSGGHNGMKSIIQHLHTSEFPRIRIGIGHQGEAINHVLTRFSKKDREVIDFTINRAADALDLIIDEGMQQAMNAYNRTEE